LNIVDVIIMDGGIGKRRRPHM